jgi:hypothetical protein
MSIAKWQAYQAKITKPRELLIRALPFVAQKEAALDLGAGSLYDSEILLKEGFKEVLAVDQTPPFRELTIPEGARFEYKESQFEDYAFPHEHFDLLSAQYALPFVPPGAFDVVWSRAKGTLKHGGIFVGQLFGDRDDWQNNPEMTFHSIEAARDALADFEILSFEEREYVEKIARAKHWHFFDIIARKRG